MNDHTDHVDGFIHGGVFSKMTVPFKTIADIFHPNCYSTLPSFFQLACWKFSYNTVSQLITRALIRLGRCPGWSAPLFCTSIKIRTFSSSSEDHFSLAAYLSGFEDALRRREHEFRIQSDEMSAKVLEYELKVFTCTCLHG